MTPVIYLGRYQAGDTVPIVLATCPDGIATPPDDAPTMLVYDQNDTLVDTLRVPIKDRYRQSSTLFAKAINMGSDYGAIRYWAFVTAAFSSTTKLIGIFLWEVLNSGNQNGQIIGMYNLEKPEAELLVWATDQGLIRYGRNPR